MTIRRQVIIVGGGIGGLSAAIALKKVGFSVGVFERQTELSEIGAAVQLWANASCAMDRLGVLETFESAAQQISAMEFTDPNGRLIMDYEVERAERETGYRAYCIHRREYIDVLKQFVEPDDIFLDAELQSFVQASDKVTARFSNGLDATGDVLIGCDGNHSATRSILSGTAKRELRPAGYVAFRGLAGHMPAAVAARPNLRGLAIGNGMQVGYAPMTGGRCYWMATLNADRWEILEGQQVRTLLLERLRSGGWQTPCTELIAATPDNGFIQNLLSDYLPDRHWGKGRVSLLGDAAHATTPNMGQGACMASEDAVALAYHLAKSRSLEIGLRGYEDSRYKRTRYVVRQSYRVGRSAMATSRLVNRFQHTLMRLNSRRIAADSRERMFKFESPLLELLAV